jgi:hypothetical protein
MKQKQSHFTVLRLFRTNDLTALSKADKVYDYPENKPLPKHMDSIVVDGKPYKVFSVRHCLNFYPKINGIELMEIQINAFEFE